MIYIFLLFCLYLYLRYPQIWLVLEHYRNSGNFLTCYDCFHYAYRVRLCAEQGVCEGLTSRLPLYASSAAGVGDYNLILILAPPLMAFLFVVPFYMFVRDAFGSRWPAVFAVGASAGLFNIIYWKRTTPGRYDTDFLILFFVFLTILVGSRLVWSESVRTAILNSALLAVSLGLLFWWYPKRVLIFLLILSVLIGLVIRGGGYLSLKVKVIAVLAFLSAFLWSGVYEELFFYIYTRIFHKGEAASISVFIRELKGVSLDYMFFYNSAPLVLLGFAGLVWLFLAGGYRRHILSFVPIVLLGISSFWAGNRMYIYLAPFLGMGAGFLLSELYRLLSASVRARGALVKALLILIGIYISIPKALDFVTSRPVIPNEVFYALKSLDKYSGKGWTWIDYGYAIRYLSGIDPLLDNGNWNMVVAKPVALSLTSDYKNEAFVLHLMDITLNRIPYRGMYCGLEQSVSYFPGLREVFLFIFESDLTSRAIYTLGGKKVGNVLIKKCEEEGSVYVCPHTTYNPEDGVIYSERMDRGVRFVERSKGNLWSMPGEGEERLMLLREGGKIYEVVYDEAVERTLMFKLFVEGDDLTNFELVRDVFPHMVVYKVK